MKKCTLCIDRIYNEISRRRNAASLRDVCPTRARSFGDLGDPASAVSELVASAAAPI